MIEGKDYIDNQIDWTKKYLDAEIKSVRDALNKSEVSSMSAVNKVEVTNTQKFEAQNEWRQAFKDQQGKFLTRNEFWGSLIGIALALAAIYFKK